MMQTTRFRPIVAALVVLSCLSGCSYLPLQARDKTPMTTVAAAMNAQTLNPSASDNRKVPGGLDPSAAQQVQESYVKSFAPKKAAATGNSVFLGLGGVGSGQ